MAVHKIDLGYKPRDWQDELHRSRKKRNVLVVHRRGGKTITSLMELAHCAMSMSGGRFAYIAPFQKQAKAVFWEPLKLIARKVPHTTINETELHVTFANGSRIRLFGADNADAIRGQGFHGVVLDEFADFAEGIFGQVIIPTLAADDGWLMVIGTPKGHDPLSMLYYQQKENPDWFCRLYSHLDTKALPDHVIQDLRSTMLAREFDLEMMCNFDAGTTDTLISGAEVEAAINRQLHPAEYGSAARILGVDVARQGDDATVLFIRQGLRGFPPIMMKGASTQEVARRVVQCWEEDSIDGICIDGTGGYGAGVIDYLREAGIPCFEINFGQKARDPRFKNMRAGMWWDMAQWIRRGGWLPPTPGLKMELCGIRYINGSDAGTFQLESKHEMKGRGLPSPDMGDALALTFSVTILPQRDAWGNRRDQGSSRSLDDWDVYGKER